MRAPRFKCTIATPLALVAALAAACGEPERTVPQAPVEQQDQPAEPAAKQPDPPPEPAVQARADAPNIFLVVLDTVRRDHLSTYGYERPTSPQLTMLTKSGVKFLNATSTAPWTHPAHGSMLTGQWPSTHGARNAGVDSAEGQKILQPAKDEVLLQEYLASAGYRTVASVGAPVLSQGFGVTRGFSAFVGAKHQAEPTAFEVNQQLFKLLDEGVSAAPLFALINYYDAHGPYVARTKEAPWIEPGGMIRQVDLVQEREGLPRYVRLATGEEKLTPKEQQAAIDNYDSEIARVDRAVAQLVIGLAARRLLDNSVMVITSDHGEYFGEHGLYDHGRTLYREMLDVPLVIMSNDIELDREVAEPVQLPDLFSTICEAAGLPVPASNQGASLWPLLRKTEAPASHPIVAEAWGTRSLKDSAPVYGADYRAIHRGSNKLIVSSTGKRQLFDLDADPGESRDLAAERPGIAEELAAALADWPPRQASTPGEPVRTTEEEEARLKALGYVQ